MRIQLLSDVHVEFHRDDGRAFVDSLDPTDVDVLVLAGDIAVGEGIPGALSRFCQRYPQSSVVYVHGNHEFYGSDRRRVCAVTERAARENENLVWLDCSLAEIRGKRFLGAPLWFPPHPDEPRLKRGMTDFTAIRDFETWVHAENARAVAFLEEELAPGDVVITHHLPSQNSVAPRYRGHPLNPFFVCDLTELIRARRPRFWFHGHTHTSARYQLGATTVVCNPFGYAVAELNGDFADKLVLEA